MRDIDSNRFKGFADYILFDRFGLRRFQSLRSRSLTKAIDPGRTVWKKESFAHELGDQR